VVDNFDFHRLLLTKSFYNIIEAVLKKVFRSQEILPGAGLLVIILGIMVGSCQKASNVVINNSPQPINTHLIYFDNDSVVIASYLAVQPAQATISDSFRAAISSTQNFKYLEVRVDNDSGSTLNDIFFTSTNGDTIAGTVQTYFENVYVGNINYTFVTYDSNGSSGNYAVKTLRLFNSKAEEPVIDSVSVPDSVKIDSNNATLLNIYAYVHDPFGISDIETVYFNSTKPDGNPAEGNPFQLRPPSNTATNEGTYSLTIQLPPLINPNPPELGTYTFTFHAVSRSGLQSDSLSHKIKVY